MAHHVVEQHLISAAFLSFDLHLYPQDVRKAHQRRYCSLFLDRGSRCEARPAQQAQSVFLVALQRRVY